MSLLVADVGGTKTVLARARPTEGGLLLDQERRYPSGDFASFEDLIRAYLAETGEGPTGAVFALAGPVRDGRCEITNLPWLIDSRRLRQRFAWPQVHLINDLEAVAWGIPALAAADLAVLQPGEEGARGNACVLAAGTGLGEAGLFWDGQRHHPFATEGGHADFAPASALEEELLGWLRQRHGHVSWERLVSGLGIGNLYRFLAERQAGLRDQARRGGQAGEVPPILNEAGADLAGTIAARAVAGSCPLCRATMDLFARLYGREAGNMALKHLALGGVYLGGGIAPRNLALLGAGGFLEAFLDKGRMTPLLQRMPVKVILNPRVALYGAWRYFAQEGGA